MVKPKIYRRGGVWFCVGAGLTLCNESPALAYRYWREWYRVTLNWSQVLE